MPNTKFIAALPFYAQLSPAEQDQLVAAAQQIIYPQKTLLQLDDQSCRGLIIVKKGWLRVFMTSESGREITLFQLQANDDCILSAACMFDNISFHSSIEAVVDSEVIIIPSHVLARLSEHHLAIQHYFMSVSQKRLSEVMWVMEQVVFQSFDQRLSGFLRQQQQFAQTDELHMTHEQIAQHLGSAREVVSRMLKYFEKEGYVQLGRGSIKIIKLP